MCQKPQSEMPLWFPIFLAAFVLAQNQVSNTVPCSKSTSKAFQLSIGNTLSVPITIHTLNNACVEEKFLPNPIAAGLTLVNLATFVGQVVFARNSTNAIVDQFAVDGNTVTWVVTARIQNGELTSTPSTSIISTTPLNTITPTSAESPSTTLPTAILAVVIVFAIIACAALFGVIYLLRKKLVKKSTSSAIVAGQEYQVIKDFEGRLQDELCVRSGDRVIVHAAYDDGWLHASKVGFSDVKGMIPSTCVGK